MSEDILVVEYEPRYTDRVRQALQGQPFTPHFARDGEEALRALTSAAPRLIVLSSVIPKISTNELIRRIRGQSVFQNTPILITVSGYTGKSTRVDAGKVGATDILPKPYSEGEFLGKVKQLLLPDDGTAETVAWPMLDPSMVAGNAADASGAGLTSDEIFGDLLDEGAAPKKPVPAPAPAPKRAAEDIDKMLADTLSGVRVPTKKKDETQPAPPSRPVEAKPKPATSDFDKMLSDTLSGLEKSARPRTTETRPPAATQPPKAPVTAPPPAAAPVPPKPVTPAPPAPVAAPPAMSSQPAAPAVKPTPAPVAPPPALVEEKVSLTSPVLKPPVVEEPEETDGIRFGQYVLLEKIATGGMAEVWKARMRGVEGFQKIVAIKKILPHLSDNDEFIEMFVDEAKLAAQLNHNNIIHIYDLGKIQNSYYIAMEFVDGHDLKSILRQADERVQQMPVELALFIGSKIAAALDYAHRKHGFDDKDLGIVHRDVSPQNVLISYEGDIKLCDFGIAKAASKASHTQAGALKGKLQYMSPEQAWGKKVDKRSDIFAVGTVLFELITGKKLFVGDNEMSILEQVREARVQKVSEINDEATPEIDAIVAKALEKDADQRYQTAGELARDIDQVLYGFRPTPTSADLAIYMHRLYSDEPEAVRVEAPRMEEAEPTVLSPLHALAAPGVVEIPAAPPLRNEPVRPEPVAAPPAPAPTVQLPAWDAPAAPAAVVAEEEPKKKPIVPIAIAAAVIAALAVGGFFLMRGKAPTPQAQVAAKQVAPVTQSAPAATDSAIATVGTTDLTTTAATTGTALGTSDQQLVDEEVQKRLAAEKARLDQQRAQQLAQQQAAQPLPAVTAQTVAPQPVAVAPTPVQEAPPQPAPQQEAPAQPQAAAPAERQYRQGDLVPVGTEGLVAPEMVRFNKPAYPPAARARRIEGLVVLNVLVSEDGRPLDIRVLRGVTPDVGINAAAVEAVRGSAFRPATKDGVRVKAYKTVTIPFKL